MSAKKGWKELASVGYLGLRYNLEVENIELYNSSPDKPTTPKAAAREMEKIVKELELDIEVRHYTADKFLCKLLIELGYERVVDKFDKMTKWYS